MPTPSRRTGAGRRFARYSGHGTPIPRRALDIIRLRVSARLDRVIEVADGSAPAVSFAVRNPQEYSRATNALRTEPGTLRWIAEQVRPGDVLYDVGANTGLFSLLAAHRSGADGRVVAFEPHAATTATLLENVALNGLGDRIDVLSCALHGSTGHLPFLYRSLMAASGLSQIGATRDPFGHDSAPVGRELKAVARADDLIAAGTIPPADLVKIDVDGNELDVLAGMRDLLGGRPRPRSVQVEVNPEGGDELIELMQSLGYDERGRHLTMGIAKLVRAGADPGTLGANVIFEPIDPA